MPVVQNMDYDSHARAALHLLSVLAEEHHAAYAPRFSSSLLSGSLAVIFSCFLGFVFIFVSVVTVSCGTT